MAVQTPAGPRAESAVDTPDAGVIDDARARQRRQRRTGAVAFVLAAAIGLIAWFAFGGGGGTARGARAAPDGGAAVTGARGSVQFVSIHTPGVRLLVAPSIGGQASICVDAFEGADGGSEGSCGEYPLPQAGLPLELATTHLPRPGTHAAPVPAGGDLYLALAAPQVVAVRVGSLGTIRVQNVPGLPSGDHAVVFREAAGSVGTVVPPGTRPAWIHTYLRGSPAIPLTALNAAGNPIPATLTSALREFFSRSNPSGFRALWTANPKQGRCAVATKAAGLVPESMSAVRRIAGDPWGGPGALLSCLWATYGFERKRFQVAILLNAESPGSPAGPIWDATPLTGHPGIVTINAPNASDNGLVARRIGNAWLVAAPWVGFPGWPTRDQTLRVLTAFHITRINLSLSLSG